MRKIALALALAGGALFGLTAGSAQAAPLSAAPGAIGAAAESMSLIDTVQYVYMGRRHCWYPSGWKGPGWYVCGNRWRRGYGWGGPAGWQGWAAPGVVVAPAPRVVVRGPYYWSGRYWHNRRWHRGRWVYW
jgi:hypothetical protein